MGIATAPLLLRLVDTGNAPSWHPAGALRRSLLCAEPPQAGAPVGVLSPRERQARRPARGTRPDGLRHPRPGWRTWRSRTLIVWGPQRPRGPARTTPSDTAGASITRARSSSTRPGTCRWPKRPVRFKPRAGGLSD
jgi:hypothetical protein